MSTTPFQQEHQLATDIDPPSVLNLEQGAITTALPGHPTMFLSNRSSLYSFLEEELLSKDLEKMAPYMWLLSQQTSTNISSLHRQLVKDRRIVITEDPRLHLVWTGDRIFIKPLPSYLLSYTFWEVFLKAERQTLEQCSVLHVRAAALGFLRSYSLLIRYESDFLIATRSDLRLLPTGTRFEQMSHLLESVRGSVSDDAVSARYMYGELRLTRLNFYGKFILHKRHFHRTHIQYGTYLAQFYGPILFVVGLLSIFLNAMQVELGVEQIPNSDPDRVWILCKWFAVLTLAGGGLLVCALASLLVYTFVKEWSHAIQERLQKKRVARRASLV